MSNKIKKVINTKLFYFILGALIFGTIGVSAATYFPSNDVTYDNTASGLSSTDVQGAIDELYGVCTAEPPAGEQIIQKASLVKDLYECRYFFKGTNPNNYITFNGEPSSWRIMSVECDGTIKIIRNESIEKKAWDTSGSNNWARPSTLNTYLNSNYYYTLSSISQNQIVEKEFSIGSVQDHNNDLKQQINDENSKKWKGKIALPTASEYIRTNSNQSSCGTYNLNDNNNTCKNTTWMNTNYNWWTLTPRVYSSSADAFFMNSDGSFYYGDTVTYTYEIRPSFYLNSNISLKGTGTKSDPYTIE